MFMFRQTPVAPARPDETFEYEPQMVARIDDYLVKHGKCDSTTFDRRSPMFNTHVGYLGSGTHTLEFGLSDRKDIITFRKYRDTEAKDLVMFYRIVSPSKSVTDTFRRTLLAVSGTDNVVEVQFINSAAAFDHTISHQNIIVPAQMKPFQADIVGKIMSWYDTHHSHCIALISGPIGVGKSLVARFLSLQYKRQHLQPDLIEGFDPTQPGQLITRFVTDRGTSTPTIILIDEIDIAMKKADSGESDQQLGNYVCSAQNKIKMCHFMDLLSVFPHFVCIYTCNTPIAQLQEKYPHYMRQGRIDILYQARD